MQADFGEIRPRGGGYNARRADARIPVESAAHGAAPTVAPKRRRPWWVLGVGMVGLIGWSGWVAAQPLPPSATPTPALKGVQSQIQQDSTQLSTLSAQAQQWQAQRSQLAATLQQDENTLAQVTGQRVQAGVAPGGSAPMPSMRVVTRAS